MSATFGQMCAYIKSRTIGFTHVGQEMIATILRLSLKTGIPVCKSLYVRVYIHMHVYVHVPMYVCKVFMEHTLLRNVTGQGMISQAPDSLYQTPA